MTVQSVITRGAPPRKTSTIAVKQLDTTEYEPTWRAMQAFTRAPRRARPTNCGSFSIHPCTHWASPRAGSSAARGEPHSRGEHRPRRTDHLSRPRPGVVYLLLDMRRRGLTVRPLVRIMENAVIDLLGGYGIAATGRSMRPASMSAEPRSPRSACASPRRCYHGLALNVDMDLTPFHAIDPCGYPGLR